MSQPTPSQDPQGQQPTYDPSQFGQPPIHQAQQGQPPYDPSQYGQQAQPQYGQPQYGQQQYGQQQYGQQQYDPSQYSQQAPYAQQPPYGQPGQVPPGQMAPGYHPAQAGRPAPQPTPLTANTDYTGAFAPEQIHEGKTVSVVGYLGILFLIPLLALPTNRFARFHANQSLVNLIAAVALGIVNAILRAVFDAVHLDVIGTLVGWVCTVAPLVLIVLGMVNAGGGKAKTLPLIGNIQLLK